MNYKLTQLWQKLTKNATLWQVRHVKQAEQVRHVTLRRHLSLQSLLSHPSHLHMRIAIDARMYGNSQCTGIGTYIEKLTSALFEIDQENEYIMFMREPEFSKFTPPNNRVKKVLVTPRWYSYGEQFFLPFQFMQEKFDLIHYPHFNSPVFFPKKSVCTIHDVTPLFFPGHKMKSIIRRLAYKLVFHATLRKAKQIIAVSESTKRGILENFNLPENKIKITYEGVDERFRIIAKNDIISETKRKFGITQPYIFFIGVWRNHKNVETLVKSFAILKEKYQVPHQLVLGGREDLHYTKIREEINQSAYKKDIITPGFISDTDLPILYNAATLFALPSFIEGFGIIAIEAQSCGCPVVSTNTTSMPEVLNDSALFFNPNDPEELAEKMFQIINNETLRQNLIKKGLQNIKRFSWQKCAKETLQIYQKTLNQ